MRETTVWDGARCDGAEHIEDLRCPMSDNVKENNRLFEVQLPQEQLWSEEESHNENVRQSEDINSQ